MVFGKNSKSKLKLYFVFSLICFFISAIAGILTYFYSDLSLIKDAKEYLSDVLKNKESFKGIFTNGLKQNLKIFIVLCISSSYVIFIPVTVFIILFKGFCAGFTSAVIINMFSLKGMANTIFTVVFPLLFSLPALSFAIALCIDYPVRKFIKNKKRLYDTSKMDYTIHLLKITVLFIYISFITLFEAIINPYFITNLN